MDATTIEQEALHLTVSERAALAYKLLESLDELPEVAADQLWLDEAARRAAEIDAGIARLIPSDEVARKARALLK